MDTKKLRQKILDLAIRGKLVPQDPNDEPASVLLERIRAEKEQLIKEGKIKRSKKSVASDTSHYENVPYTLPNGWCWCKLGDLCSFESGFAFSSNDFKTSGIPLVRISNIQDSTVTLKNCVFIQDEVDEKYIIKTGDLLIAMSGATTGKMGIYSMRQRALLNQRVGNICVQSRHLTANYRNYFMYSQSDVILKMAYGGAQPNISSQMILNIPIPLPPLSEQYRIVNAIKNLLEIVDRIEENQISLDKLLCSIKQKILQLALSGNLLTQDHNDEPAIDLLRRINPSYIPCDNRHYENVPYKVPEKWQWVTLSDISNYGECINVPVSNIPEDSWILELEDIEKDSGRLIKRMNKSKRNINGVRHSFKKGDVLYSKLRTYLNKVLVADQDGYCTTEIIPITCAQGIVPEYLCHVLRSRYYVDYTISLGYGVKMPRLGTADALKSMIPVPPYEEQIRIVKSVNEIYHKLEQISSEL